MADLPAARVIACRVFSQVGRSEGRHKYAFTTDIQMMFRQILIDPAQRDLLRIMGKTGANDKPVIYRLKSVTYGTASAPFSAIRTLKQLAMDEASRFP
ncbi:DUF1758 domain-containing protein [Trichonephila clavata]|uniref:DUF1758 domain-containing protein n=1 Tax=Trichonephila clavata TaxID=2740835 RepID=A0A8X6FFJ7_TRICU|nr:DUF1758 domain-containing protein [Trichonephila clavata]